MHAIILLGGPGAGKGTAAKMLGDGTPYLHISTGDMLREAVKNSTEVGREAESYMKRGELVPDDVIIQIVEQKLAGGHADDAYLFDGFPRTVPQADLLNASFDRRGAAVRFVFNLDAPVEALVTRLSGRRICRACGANYHVVNIPPREEGVCDSCGGELYQRADDEEDTIRHRIDVFREQTAGLIDYYAARNLLVTINAGGTPEQTADAIDRVLNS